MHALKLQNQYYISSNPDDIDLGAVCRLLWNVHWAAGRPKHIIEKSIKNSRCFGVFKGYEQIGFARVVTDYATYAYISDVVICGHYRGQSLGHWLIKHILTHHEFIHVDQWRLKTTYAHAFIRSLALNRLNTPTKFLEILK